MFVLFREIPKSRDLQTSGLWTVCPRAKFRVRCFFKHGELEMVYSSAEFGPRREVGMSRGAPVYIERDLVRRNVSRGFE